ncbi:hypothetical protein [Clostridium sp.]|uniref:hypothetical protein n=1 Tax=Clostridium sp. TaxID=1506 RepID=UPI0025B7F96D|nr:hypothetical protein [Clostridium sp.]
MKFKFEKNLRIVNEMMTYLYKSGASDIHVELHTEDDSSSFLICGKIKEIDDIELYNLKKILNTPRQHEVEEYYWHLGGECELDGELSLVGMMIDKAEISYNDSILSIKIYRSDC